MEQTPSPYEALLLAIDEAGGQSAIARICDVTQPAVWKWVQSSKRLPADYVLRVEAATNVSRHWLRPDIYPVDLAPAPKQLRWASDRRNPARTTGLDRRSGHVALDRRAETKGASL